MSLVLKLNAEGTALVYSTFIGGNAGQDAATAIAVDAQGYAYITGQTTDSDYPTTTGAYQSGGGAFVTKLNQSGTSLVYSTKVSGIKSIGIALDAETNAYITGSGDSYFATTAGAFQSSLASASGKNAAIAKLNPQGTAMLYATFLGGSGADEPRGIAVDAEGHALVAGVTTSADFPTEQALQPTLTSSGEARSDGFVTKLNADGTGLLFSTFLGGGMSDSANAIALDASGNVYIAGETYSEDFPVENAFQPKKAGYLLENASLGNGFITKLDLAGKRIVYSSFLGGEACQTRCESVFGTPEISADVVYGVAVDALGHAYLTGRAKSYTFPLINSVLPRQEDARSHFVTKVSVAGNSLLYSTLLSVGAYGGVEATTGVPHGAGRAIAVDSTGSAYVTGDVESTTTFTTTPGAFQPQSASYGHDAIGVKLGERSVALTLSSSANPSTLGAPVTLTATVPDTTLTGTVRFMADSYEVGSAPLVNGRAEFTHNSLGPGIYRLTAIIRSPDVSGSSPVLYQVNNRASVCE
jgi:hypothetical protein